jgi:hypothetical protein
MRAALENRKSKIENPWTLLLKWLARGFFAAAVLAVLYGAWLGHTRPQKEPEVRQAAVHVDWAREPFSRWTSVEDGVELLYPGRRYDAVRGFGQFTSRDVAGGIQETDIVAFRSAAPRSVIAVAAYKAPRPLSWDEWVALAKGPVSSNSQPPAPNAPAPFSAEFGGSDQAFRMTTVGGRQALAVSARSAVRYPIRANTQMELWQTESRLVAQGDRAVRITAAVHTDHYEAARPGLERTLESFRWNPPVQ